MSDNPRQQERLEELRKKIELYFMGAQQARAGGYIQVHVDAFVDETMKLISQYTDSLLEASWQKLADLHLHSDSRAAELETSEDGYTYGLEDAQKVVLSFKTGGKQ